MLPSQLAAICLFFTIYILLRINFTIIEIYLYLKKLESIACYLAHKWILLICINLKILHVLYFLLFEKIFVNKYSLKINSDNNLITVFVPNQMKLEYYLR